MSRSNVPEVNPRADTLIYQGNPRGTGSRPALELTTTTVAVNIDRMLFPVCLPHR